MNIKIGEHIVQVQILEQSGVTSKHTGEVLKHMKVEFRVRGKSINEEILGLIDGAKMEGLASVDENGDSDKMWKVGNSSWRYTEGSPLYYHTLEIQEMENLNIEMLKVGNLKLKPYSYEEEIDLDDNLIIRARVAVTEDEHNQLKELWKSKSPLQVIRKGISNEPKQMIIDGDNWSSHDDMYKHIVLLSERKVSGDKKTKRRFPTLAWVGATTDQAAANKELIDGLFTILEQKGLLSSDEVNQIRSWAEERRLDRKYELHRVEDIDEYE